MNQNKKKTSNCFVLYTYRIRWEKRSRRGGLAHTADLDKKGAILHWLKCFKCNASATIKVRKNVVVCCGLKPRTSGKSKSIDAIPKQLGH